MNDGYIGRVGNPVIETHMSLTTVVPEFSPSKTILASRIHTIDTYSSGLLEAGVAALYP